jgi:hypothetical protein
MPVQLPPVTGGGARSTWTFGSESRILGLPAGVDVPLVDVPFVEDPLGDDSPVDDSPIDDSPVVDSPVDDPPVDPSIGGEFAQSFVGDGWFGGCGESVAGCAATTRLAKIALAIATTTVPLANRAASRVNRRDRRGRRGFRDDLSASAAEPTGCTAIRRPSRTPIRR